MNTGWSCKEASAVLGVRPTKVTQALGPALRKVALLMLADPARTLASLHAAMEEERRRCRSKSNT